MAGGLGRPPKVKEAGGTQIILRVSFSLGRPCPEHVSRGALSFTCPSWSFRAKAGPRTACWMIVTCSLPSWMEDERLKSRRKSGKPAVGGEGARLACWGWGAPGKAPHYPFPCVPSGARSLVEPVLKLSRRWGP